MAKYDINWPENITVQGQLSFPIKSQAEIEELAAWRVTKGIKPPQFDDKIGGTLILNQLNYDKVYEYLTETYLPFAIDLYKITNGEKGIDPDLTEELLKQAKKKVWIDPTDKKKRPNMPIRDLSDKDIENMGDFDGVAKVKFSGPYNNNEIKVKAIVKDSNGKQTVVSIDDLIDEGILPEGHTDPNRLWWGSNWKFRTSFRFNAFDSAMVGVSAYAQTLYLLPHLGLETFGGNDDSIVTDEDLDWEE